MTTEQQRIKDALDLSTIPGILVREIRTFLFTGRLEEAPFTGDQDDLMLNLPAPEFLLSGSRVSL